MGWEVGKWFKEGMHVYLWLIHIDIWQKLSYYCKAIILQLKFKKNKNGARRPPNHQVNLSKISKWQSMDFFPHVCSALTHVYNHQTPICFHEVAEHFEGRGWFMPGLHCLKIILILARVKCYWSKYWTCTQLITNKSITTSVWHLPWQFWLNLEGALQGQRLATSPHGCIFDLSLDICVPQGH